jgi:MoaA/NifB/PqqE/SkfB family radical SAM enzyme
MNESIKCYYSLGGINYKNGFVTSCPQQSDQLYVIEEGKSIKPSDIINSEGFKNHRKEMMSGTWSAGCHLCKEVEEAGAGKSMRQDFPADDTKFNPDTGEILLSGVKHVELRFSNACNFACLHCSVVYSSGWMSKLKYYEADEEDRKHNLIQLTKRMHRSSDTDTLSIDLSMENMEQIVRDLNTHFPNIEKIDFAGGEVLYQKQFLPCLELLSEHPNKDNIAICFHTNFNAKSDLDKLYNLLILFGSNLDIGNRTTIMMSLDSGKNIYPYFRTGNWEVLKENIRTFQALDVDNKIHMTIVCTTSAYQIMDLVNVFESFLELNINGINSSIVYTPRYLNPSLMMLKFSNKVLEDITKVKSLISKEKIKRFSNLEESIKLRSWGSQHKSFSDLNSAKAAIDNIETYVKNNVPTIEEYEALQVYIRKTDVIWKQNFNDHFKEYKFINNEITRTQT